MSKKRLKKFFSYLCCCFLVGLWFGHLYAQAGKGKGRLQGVVVDEANKPIGDATVRLVWQEDQKISRKTQTKENGKFLFVNLAPGVWEVKMSQEGYVPKNGYVEIRQLFRAPTLKITLRKAAKTLRYQELNGKDDLLEKGHQLFDAARYDEALVLYNKFLENHPDSQQVHVFIGDCYKAKEEYDRAMAEYKKVLDSSTELGPGEKSQVYTAVGDLYLRKDDPGTAVVYFDQALAWHPDAQVAFNMGQVFFSHNKAEESARYFRQAAAINPTWGDPYMKLGYIYLNSRDYKNAIASFRKFLELSPGSAQAAEIRALIKKLSKTLD